MRPLPRPQGHFDGLCGPYAVINAIADLFPRGFKEQERPLFEALIGSMNERMFRAALLRGTSVNDMRRLMRIAAGFVGERGLGEIRWSNPFRTEAPERIDRFWNRLGERVEAGRSVAILAIERPEQHWTVGTVVKPSTIRLKDSARMKELRRGTCTVGLTGTKRRLNPRETFVVRRVGG